MSSRFAQPRALRTRSWSQSQSIRVGITFGCLRLARSHFQSLLINGGHAGVHTLNPQGLAKNIADGNEGYGQNRSPQESIQPISFHSARSRRGILLPVHGPEQAPVQGGECEMQGRAGFAADVAGRRGGLVRACSGKYWGGLVERCPLFNISVAS